MGLKYIDSGQVPRAEGLSGGDLQRCVNKWQKDAMKLTWDTPSRLLDIIGQVDRLRLWEHPTYEVYGFTGRNDFLARQVLIHFDVLTDEIPEIMRRLLDGEAPADVLVRAQEAGKAAVENPVTTPGGSTGGVRPATVAKAEQVRELRAAGATQAEVAREVGVQERRVRDLEKVDTGSNECTTENRSTLKTAGTPLSRTTAAHRARVLARDHPDIAARLAEGEFSSVSEAERAAGVRPPKPTPAERWLKNAERFVPLLTEEQREVLRGLLSPC